MRKFFLIIFSMIFIIQGFIYSDNKQKIGELGDKAWNALIEKYKSDGLFTEIKDTKEIVQNIKNYEGKLMQFPKINFNDFITDKYYKKYYYYGEKSSYNFYVIKYNDDIFKKMQKLVSVFGVEKGEYEAIGIVKEAYTWWGNVILMDIRAMRKPGVFCVTVDNDKVSLIGEELVEKELAAKAEDPYKGMPKKLKSVPKGLDPLIVAKLFYYVGSVEKNNEVWLQLLSKTRFSGSSPSSSTKNYWETLVNKNWTYFLVREDTGWPNDTKKYFFQRQENGQNYGAPVPITIKLEDGEWKVYTASF